MLRELMWLPRWRLDTRKLERGTKIRLTSRRRIIEAEVINPDTGFVVITAHFLRTEPGQWGEIGGRIDASKHHEAGQPVEGQSLSLPRIRTGQRIVLVLFPDDRFWVWTQPR